MLIYIIRHAWAGQAGDTRYPDDTQRPLTDDGRKRFRKVVKHLAKCGVAPQRIATSPLLRCRQTAELLLEGLEATPSLSVLEALEPGASWSDVLPWLQHQTDVPELALVGHAPDVGMLVGSMIGGGEAMIDFAKGAVACVEFADQVTTGGGSLRWMVTAKIIGE
jgi:phosphohistidine phosphatase